MRPPRTDDWVQVTGDVWAGKVTGAFPQSAGTCTALVLAWQPGERGSRDRLTAKNIGIVVLVANFGTRQ